MAESTGAIITAAGANLAIAAAKFIGAALTGSAAMLAEGVHSVVDTLNQVLLLVGLKRAKRKPDAIHPYGYGREIYFYSFVVALMIFLAGGLYSVYEGVEKILHPEEMGEVSIFGFKVSALAVNLAILGFSIAVESYSFYVAVKAMPDSEDSPLATIRRSKDPSLFVVLVEDLAALLGLVLALVGVSLAHVLEMPVLDGVSSMTIGVVLIGMALFLMIETHGLLIGEAADPDTVAAIKSILHDEPAVRRVKEILTQHLGPADILVNVSMDIAGHLGAGEIEAMVGRLDASLKARCNEVKRVFIEIQSSAEPSREAPMRASA